MDKSQIRRGAFIKGSPVGPDGEFVGERPRAAMIIQQRRGEELRADVVKNPPSLARLAELVRAHSKLQDRANEIRRQIAKAKQ